MPKKKKAKHRPHKKTKGLVLPQHFWLIMAIAVVLTLFLFMTAKTNKATAPTTTSPYNYTK